MAGDLNLSNLKPAQAQKARKRVGRGLGSGKGRYSGRGIKGQKSRAGLALHARRVRGRPDARVHAHGQAARLDLEGRLSDRPLPDVVWSLNVRDLARFDAGTEVTPELLKEKGPVRNLNRDIKILGYGDIAVKLASPRTRSRRARPRRSRPPAAASPG
jgi:large subunit ribosomal protein L15